MKYFTPELYLRYNLADASEADQAEAEWERAIDGYTRFLKENRGRMPANVRMLAEKCYFHDAVLLGRQTHEQRRPRETKANKILTLGLAQGDETMVLYYFLTGSPSELKRRKSWPFSQQRKHWLYDEVALEGDHFSHRILWSDGSESEVPFMDVILDRFPSLTAALS